MVRDCNVYIITHSSSIHTVSHKKRFSFLQYGLRRLWKLRRRVCIFGIPLEMGCFQTVIIVTREMGNKIGYNLGQVNGCSHCNKAVFSAEWVAKSKPKFLDKNPLSNTRQRFYKFEANGDWSRFFSYQNPIVADQGYLFASRFIHRAKSQLQTVVAWASTGCIENQMSCHAFGIQGRYFC